MAQMTAGLTWAWLLIGSVGCASTSTLTPVEQIALADTARTYLEMAIRFPDNPAVRAQAMEAAGQVLGSEARPYLREGLSDEHPGVRFAACMALGSLDEPGDVKVVRSLVDHADPNVRIGAYFVLERTGDYRYRRAWRDLLWTDPDPEVRGNAALAMGQLKDPKVARLLSMVANDDPHDGVRVQALEGLALLGDADAVGKLLFQSFGGIGGRQPIALLALGQVKDPRVIPTLRRGLDNAPYLEARLAAARSLGAQGYDEGYDLALEALDWDEPAPGLPDDPPANQIMRVRTMAALALGEIGDPNALEPLEAMMENPEDPRVQLAAATAILMITNAQSAVGQ
jgi:HEAT repeat protein